MRWPPFFEPLGAFFKLAFVEAAPVVVSSVSAPRLHPFGKRERQWQVPRRPPSPVLGVLFLTATGGLISSPNCDLLKLTVPK